ncbi:hypothetical protein RFI_18609, partial [Reticulomyxa filosa]
KKKKKSSKDKLTPEVKKSEENYDRAMNLLQQLFPKRQGVAKRSDSSKYRYPVLLEKKFELFASDLDWNGHVNQSEYVRFVWNTLCEFEPINNPKQGFFLKDEWSITNMTQTYRKEVLMRPKWWSKNSQDQKSSSESRAVIPEPFCTVYLLDVSSFFTTQTDRTKIERPLLSANQMEIFGLIEQCENECFFFRVVVQKTKSFMNLFDFHLKIKKEQKEKTIKKDHTRAKQLSEV